MAPVRSAPRLKVSSPVPPSMLSMPLQPASDVRQGASTGAGDAENIAIVSTDQGVAAHPAIHAAREEAARGEDEAIVAVAALQVFYLAPAMASAGDAAARAFVRAGNGKDVVKPGLATDTTTSIQADEGVIA